MRSEIHRHAIRIEREEATRDPPRMPTGRRGVVQRVFDWTTCTVEADPNPYRKDKDAIFLLFKEEKSFPYRPFSSSVNSPPH